MSYRFSLSFVAKQARFGAYALVASLGVTTGFGVVFGGSGCGGELGGECMLDGDCDEAFICAYQFCHVPCTKTVDCTKTDPNSECIIGHEGGKAPYNYCAQPTPCQKDVECGDGRVCADGKCRERCINDGGCLGDQACSGGFCHSVFVEGSEKAAKGGWCGINSDCLSQNCTSQVCNGCAEDGDCANGGPCDNTCDNGVGRCGSCDMGGGGAGGMGGASSSGGEAGAGGMGGANSSGSSSSGEVGGGGGMGGSGGAGGGMSGACPNDTFNATVTEIPLNGYTVVDATPNANGTAIYFVATLPVGSDRGIFKVDVQGGAPESICEYVYPFTILVNSDDTTLFVTEGTGELRTLGTTPGTCMSNNFMPLAWAQNLYAVWGSAIYGDTLYFVGPDIVGQNGIPTIYKGTVDVGGIYISPLSLFSSVNLTIGANQIFALDSSLYSIPKSSKIADRIGALSGASLALNYTEDTLYTVRYDNPVYRIQSFDIVNLPKAPNNPNALCVKTGYILNDGGAGGNTKQHLARAHNADVYSWVNEAGKLYLFKPQ